MLKKRIEFSNITGINRDISISKGNNKSAYYIKNLRLTSSDLNDLFVLVSEKGTSATSYRFEGMPIGYCVLNDVLVVFTSEDTTTSPSLHIDRIYKIDFTAEVVNPPLIYLGNLGFSTEHPIETLACYESESVLKVYWVDGINLPRLLNICRSYGHPDPNDLNAIIYDDIDCFDFARTINNESTTDLANSIIALVTHNGGLFQSGVILYAFSLYNKYGLETQLIEVSPLLYLSSEDKGEEPNKNINCSVYVGVYLSAAETQKYDFVRLYSIYRSSLNGPVTVKRISNIKVEAGDTPLTVLDIVDDGTIGETVDPNILYFTGAKVFKPYTMTQKDGTLFFGNFTENSDLQPTSLRDLVNIYTSTGADYTIEDLIKSFYPYKNCIGHNYRHNNYSYLKTGEYYLLGVLFLDKWGKWSEPYFISEYLNTSYPILTIDQSNNKFTVRKSYPYVELSDLMGDIITNNIPFEMDYVRVRPVISYPTISERTVLCLGVLNPTIFNLQERVEGTCYSLASWFFRPFGVETTIALNGRHLSAPLNLSYKWYDSQLTPSSGWNRIDIPWDHLGLLLSSDDMGGEVLSMYNDYNALPQLTPQDPLRPYKNAHRISDSIYDDYKSFFYIDLSTLTFNSPDIEFDEQLYNIDISDYKVRIIGYLPITLSSGGYDIMATSPLFFRDKGDPEDKKISSKLLPGFNKHILTKKNTTSELASLVCTQGCWFDDIAEIFVEDGVNHTGWNSNSSSLSYLVYPWLRLYLNNTNHGSYLIYGSDNTEGLSISDEPESSKIERKVLSNLRYVTKTEFFDFEDNNPLNTNKLHLFSSNEETILKLENNKLYKGNINLIISCTSKFIGKGWADVDPNKLAILWPEEKLGYPILISDIRTPDYDTLYIMNHGVPTTMDTIQSKGITPNFSSVDPILIKYKSSPHIVFSMGTTDITEGLDTTTYLELLPISAVLRGWDSNIDLSDLLWRNKYNEKSYAILPPLVDANNHRIEISDNGSPLYNYLFLAEVYNDSYDTSPFAGITDYLLQLRTWLPCGEAINIYVNSDEPHTLSNIRSGAQLEWTDGDTYFQRYDCLKTYPFSNDDYQSVIEILSFNCETRVNLDGRYDSNRGLLDNYYITPNNFNLLNPVYNQKNNLFLYKINDYYKTNNDSYKNMITWGLTKINNSDVDTWTNITLANTLDIDGDKGPISSLNTFNNKIICFLDKGISQILFNENIALTSSSGLPVYLSNSGKVNGKLYISDNIGCMNKWSICSTPKGLYFVDSINKDINILNGNGITSLSDSRGMTSWAKQYATTDIWRPETIDSSITFYDKINEDVYFIMNNKCLAYSEKFGLFTGFYSYQDVLGFPWVNDNGYMIHLITDLVSNSSSTKYTLWNYQKGIYNSFFGSLENSELTLMVNPESSQDKIFDIVEFNADLFNYRETTPVGWYYNKDGTFSSIRVYNEYLDTGIVNLTTLGPTNELTPTYSVHHTSNLKKKFRTWRIAIPRNSNSRDRIRNPWTYINLVKQYNTSFNGEKFVIHDISVDYFV